jgi:hypothetical protein
MNFTTKNPAAVWLFLIFILYCLIKYKWFSLVYFVVIELVNICGSSQFETRHT